MNLRTAAAAVAAAAALLPAAEDDTPAASVLFNRLHRQRIAIEVRDRPVGAVLRDVAERHGLAIRWSPADQPLLDRPLTLREDDIALSRLLWTMCRRYGFSWSVDQHGTIDLRRAAGVQADDPPPAWTPVAAPVLTLELSDEADRPLATWTGPPAGWRDPIAALSAEDEALLTGTPGSNAFTRLLEHHLDRIEAWHLAHSHPAPGLMALLTKQPELRRDLWTALDWQFDDAPAALALLEQLRAEDETRFLRFRHLALALAVVYDQPDAQRTSRLFTLWGVAASQFAPVSDGLAVWCWFTDPAHQALFRFRPDHLAWPLLTHQVDLALTDDERTWAVAQYQKTRDLGTCYQEVPYDTAKLMGITQALGRRPYTLPFLKERGGVCVDQAHYAAEIAKLFGVPALKCHGEGRYGPPGHAWTGYLAAADRAPQLKFTGRYRDDFYYTGTGFDPQTRTEILDRHIALLHDAVSGRYEAWREARQLTRIALALETSRPALAATIATEARRRNAWVADAWRLLMRQAAAGTLPVADASSAFKAMRSALARHPDLVVECLQRYLTGLPSTPLEPRLALYRDLDRVCAAARRPDLVIAVRLDQMAELTAVRRTREAIVIAFETVRDHITEGQVVMPMVRRLVTLATELHSIDPTFRLDQVKSLLVTQSERFPLRGMANPAWVEYQDLSDSLP